VGAKNNMVSRYLFIVFIAALSSLITMSNVYAGNTHTSQCYSRVLTNQSTENESIATRFSENNAGSVRAGQDSLTNSGTKEIETHEKLGDFELSIHADDGKLPAFFKEKLSLRINKTYDWLAGLLPVQSAQSVEVNLWVFNDRDDYQQFKQTHVPHLSAMSIGFHSSRKNIAAVWQKSDKQVLHTSVHEAVHVINSGMFGYLPRWTNEGLAEYIEDMSLQGQVAVVEPKLQWLRVVADAPLKLEYVLSSGYAQWNAENRRTLYAHSWALMYFLMSQKNSQAMLKAYLAENLTEPCRRLDTAGYFGQHYPGGLASMEHDFSNWLDSNKTPHHY